MWGGAGISRGGPRASIRGSPRASNPGVNNGDVRAVPQQTHDPTLFLLPLVGCGSRVNDYSHDNNSESDYDGFASVLGEEDKIFTYQDKKILELGDAEPLIWRVKSGKH